MRSREQDGLRSLLDATAPRVTFWLQREFGGRLSAIEIDEALTDAAHRAWRSIDRFARAKGTLRGWFYGICRNAALGVLARQRRDGHFLSLDACAELAADEPRERAESGFTRDFRRCVARLPALQRAVIEADLATAGGTADAATLARSLGSSPNSVYNARSLARARLKAALVELGHLEADDDDRAKPGTTEPGP